MNVTLSMPKDMKEWAANYAASGGMSLSGLVGLVLSLLRRDRIQLTLLVRAQQEQEEQDSWEERQDENQKLCQDFGIPYADKEETL